MRDYSRRDSPQIGNGEVNAQFWILRRDVRDMGNKERIAIVEDIPPLETSISFHEVGTPAAKRSATIILALTIGRQAHMLGTPVQSHQDDPR